MCQIGGQEGSLVLTLYPKNRTLKKSALFVQHQRGLGGNSFPSSIMERSEPLHLLLFNHHMSSLSLKAIRETAINTAGWRESEGLSLEEQDGGRGMGCLEEAHSTG